MPVRAQVFNFARQSALPDPSAPGKTFAAGVANSVIAATAFLFTCAALRIILPFPEIDGGVSQKFRFFAAHKEEFDTLFIGSSRIYFQISPAIFDRVTRERGWPTRSFNFGIGGMYLPESAYVLEQILNLKPRRLKWVFIEYDEMQTRWSPQNQTSRRALYWADWRRVSLLLRKLTDAGAEPVWRPNLEKCRDIVLRRGEEKNTRSLLTFYVTQLERNYTNVSRGADLWDRLSRRNTRPLPASYLGAANDGYVARPGAMSLTQTAAYQRALATAMAAHDSRTLSPYAVEAYRQCAQRVRDAGAVPIFLIPPSTTQIGLTAERTGLSAAVLAFNDPRAYPSLYRSDARRDGQHLTRSASEEFSRLVAANFVELVRAGRRPMNKN